MQGSRFSANFVPYELEKIRQATRWGIKMLKSNFYSGLVTEEAVVRGVQLSAQKGGVDLQASPGRRGRLCLPHGVCRLAADGGEVWKDLVGSAMAGRRQQRLFRHKEAQSAFLGDEGPSRHRRSRGRCASWGLTERGLGPPPGARGLSGLIRPHPP